MVTKYKSFKFSKKKHNWKLERNVKNKQTPLGEKMAQKKMKIKNKVGNKYNKNKIIK